MNELHDMVNDAKAALSEKRQHEAAMRQRAEQYAKPVIALIDKCDDNDKRTGEACFALLRRFDTPADARDLLGIIEGDWRKAHAVKEPDPKNPTVTKVRLPSLPRSYVTTKNALLRDWEAQEELRAAWAKSAKEVAIAANEPELAIVPEGFLDLASERYQGTDKRPGVDVRQFREDVRKARAAKAATERKAAESKKGGTLPKALQEYVNGAIRAVHDAYDRGVKAEQIINALTHMVMELESALGKADEAILAEAVAETEQDEAANG